MLKRVLIEDNTNLPLSYAKDLKAFKNGIEYNFRPGINIIIGPNGCGKSTLMNILSMFFWCSSNMESDFFKGLDGIDRDHLFNEDNTVKDGIIINHDYISKVFMLKTYKDFKRDEGFSSFNNFSLMFHSKTSSVGEGTVLSIEALFDLMFKKGQTYDFVIKKLREQSKNTNDIWKERFTKLIDYYEKNKINPREIEITVLMDEPDRNLDIINIDDIYGILSFHKPQTQIIASIHNPLLIYKLSKIEEINFIELEENYLMKVKTAINNIVK